ncbi:MAG: T9SS type A sorting domain-containing protein [Bacteroidetes bacterium]|nr:MAG: T9SS type A sorting domain-containing protein [Bacteroidota bacterium]
MKHAKTLIWIFIIISMTGVCLSQEFPIAVGNDDTFGGGGAFDGTNFLFAIMGDSLNQYNITAQLVSTSGNLVGSRFSLGSTGSTPFVAFDGTNYLVVWSDSFPMFGGDNNYYTGNIYGQFVSTSGTLVGTTITFVTGVNNKFARGRGGLTVQDTTYLLTYMKGGDHTDYLYGQRIGKSGNLLGGEIQISNDYARESAVAFDGTNYLVAWCKMAHPNTDKDIYGQFISTSGVAVGTNFLIDGSDNASDNPVTMTFDGTRYLVAFHEQAADSEDWRWNLYARFVTTAGDVQEKFIICDSSKNPTFATSAFDGTNYLITWIEQTGTTHVQGRFFTATGIPLDTAFTLFDTLGGKFPIGGVGGFVDGNFILSVTRLNTSYHEADIYGMFLPSSIVGVKEDELNPIPKEYALSQNYPNPFNPLTVIKYSVVSNQYVSLKVYNILGEEIATLVDGIQDAGYKIHEWNANGLPSGVYFYRLQAGAFVETKKLVLLR